MSDTPSKTTHSIATSRGRIHVTDLAATAGAESASSTALLLIHGNSSDSRLFQNMLARPAAHHRLLAMDLAGHGQSENAAADEAAAEIAYTQGAYAQSAVEVLAALGVREVVLLGASLGGHIAIEMLPLLEAAGSATACRGIMISGSPPVKDAMQIYDGFKFGNAKHTVETKLEVGPPGAEVWTEEEYNTFTYKMYGKPHEPWMKEAAVRTDGRARRIMFDYFGAGHGVDQRAVLAASSVPCAVVNGAHEPFVNLDYLDSLTYGNLWEGKCHRLFGKDGRGLGHYPFWEENEAFQPFWERFVKDCTGVEY